MDCLETLNLRLPRLLASQQHQPHNQLLSALQAAYLDLAERLSLCSAQLLLVHQLLERLLLQRPVHSALVLSLPRLHHLEACLAEDLSANPSLRNSLLLWVQASISAATIVQLGRELGCLAVPWANRSSR